VDSLKIGTLSDEIASFSGFVPINRRGNSIWQFEIKSLRIALPLGFVCVVARGLTDPP